jgi:hypothetical protein
MVDPLSIAFIPIIVQQLNRFLDAEIANEKLEELSRATLIEVFLVCINDWKVKTEGSYRKNPGQEIYLLEKYAELFTYVSSKFRSRDLLSEEWLNRIVDTAKKMQRIAFDSEIDPRNLYRSDELFNEIKNMLDEFKQAEEVI